MSSSVKSGFPTSLTSCIGIVSWPALHLEKVQSPAPPYIVSPLDRVSGSNDFPREAAGTAFILSKLLEPELNADKSAVFLIDD